MRFICIPGSGFVKNQSGYPVLTKATQALILKYTRHTHPPWLLLSDVGQLPGTNGVNALASDAASSDRSASPTPAEAAARPVQSPPRKKQKDPTPHLSYIRHLQGKQAPRTTIERFGSGYQDYLQSPLQPLTDDLESVTYEVFEKDPVKYNCYENAIAAALEDWGSTGKSRSGPNDQVVVAVVGAGRGPLVTRALQAADSVGVDIELWAVEKNPNAFVLLQKHNERHWGGKVNVVKSDMRSWNGPSRPVDTQLGTNQDIKAVDIGTSDDGFSETNMTYGKVDILISELLGSFGDNELSPECLDGVKHVMNPVHGISIPSSYTSHLTPIATPRIHSEIRSRSASDPSAPETPYVVMLHAFDNLATTPATSANEPVILKAWEFSHFPSTDPAGGPRQPGRGKLESEPRKSGPGTSNFHNARFTRLKFPCPSRGACDGLAGYFEAILWGNVELSTRPDEIDKKSPDMISWFPLFFPLKVR